MMSDFGNHVRSGIIKRPVWEKINGAAFIVLGLLALIAQLLHIPYFWGIAFVGMGLVFTLGGWRFFFPVYVYLGNLIMALGIGMILLLSSGAITFEKLGDLFGVISSGFFIASLAVYLRFKRFFWWSLFPTAVFGGLSVVFVFTSFRWVDFVFWMGILLGAAFLLSGGYLKLVGLVIPGCLLSAIGLGVHFGFGVGESTSIIGDVGVLLLWFAAGWGAIPLFTRWWCDYLHWWPMIPAGIIGIVGLGLFIGGNPDNAAFFIGNTSAVLFIAIGLYLILLRRGMHSG